MVDVDDVRWGRIPGDSAAVTARGGRRAIFSAVFCKAFLTAVEADMVVRRGLVVVLLKQIEI